MESIGDFPLKIFPHAARISRAVRLGLGLDVFMTGFDALLVMGDASFRDFNASELVRRDRDLLMLGVDALVSLDEPDSRRTLSGTTRAWTAVDPPYRRPAQRGRCAIWACRWRRRSPR